MSKLNIKKISENKFGKLFKVQSIIQFFLTDAVSPFGIEENYNKKIIKWTITDSVLLQIREMEETLLSHFKKLYGDDIILETKVHKRNNYPNMIEVLIEGDSDDIIEHKPGEIVLFSDIQSGKRANVQCALKSVNIGNNRLHYTLVTKKLSCVI
jgi:hypothetical protein